MSEKERAVCLTRFILLLVTLGSTRPRVCLMRLVIFDQVSLPPTSMQRNGWPLGKRPYSSPFPPLKANISRKYDFNPFSCISPKAPWREIPLANGAIEGSRGRRVRGRWCGERADQKYVSNAERHVASSKSLELYSTSIQWYSLQTRREAASSRRYMHQDSRTCEDPSRSRNVQHGHSMQCNGQEPKPVGAGWPRPGHILGFLGSESLRTQPGELDKVIGMRAGRP